jgi:hypothetical protein
VVEGLRVSLLEKTRGRVALAAGSGQSPLVDILVTVAALLVRNRLVERNRFSVSITWQVESCGHVALLAGDVEVLSGEGITRLVVIEARRGFPVREAVAAVAVLAQGALVVILVTGQAGGLQPDPAPGRVFALGQGCGAGDPILRLVAVLALHGGVFAGEGPAGPLVVELLGCSLIPLDQVEIPAGVLRMTSGAVLVVQASVKPPALLHQPGDPLVAPETLLIQAAGAGPVALQTFQRAIQIAVDPRQRARRDLGSGGKDAEHD